jgi:hypothetical protein
MYTFTAPDRVVHIFARVVLKKNGKHTITATDAVGDFLTTAVSIDVIQRAMCVRPEALRSRAQRAAVAGGDAGIRLDGKNR